MEINQLGITDYAFQERTQVFARIERSVSSRMSRSGSWISEQHSPSFCRMPPESCFAGGSAKDASPVPCRRSEILQLRSERDCPNKRPKNSMFSRTLRSG